MDKNQRNALLARMGFTLHVTSYVRAKNGSHHYSIDITYRGVPWLSMPYSQGSAITEEPTLVDVLYALKIDADCARSDMDLADFLVEYGRATDAKSIREGMAAYDACRKTNEKFKELPNNVVESIDVALEDF